MTSIHPLPEYVITVKDEVCTSEMKRYGFKQANSRLFYVTSYVILDEEVSFTCPNFNAMTKENIFKSFTIDKKAFVDATKIDNSYYRIKEAKNSED